MIFRQSFFVKEALVVDGASDVLWSIEVNGVELTRVKPGESVVIGRKPIRPIVETEANRRLDISDPEKSMSKRHAKISVDSYGRAILEDLGSTNGSFVVRDDGALMRVPLGTQLTFQRSPMHLQFGEVAVDFREVSDDSTGEHPVANLFDNMSPEAVAAAANGAMSVDQILDVRAGEPTAAFDTKAVRGRVHDLNTANLAEAYVSARVPGDDSPIAAQPTNQSAQPSQGQQFAAQGESGTVAPSDVSAGAAQYADAETTAAQAAAQPVNAASTPAEDDPQASSAAAVAGAEPAAEPGVADSGVASSAAAGDGVMESGMNGAGAAGVSAAGSPSDAQAAAGNASDASGHAPGQPFEDSEQAQQSAAQAQDAYDPSTQASAGYSDDAVQAANEEPVGEADQGANAAGADNYTLNHAQNSAQDAMGADRVDGQSAEPVAYGDGSAANGAQTPAEGDARFQPVDTNAYNMAGYDMDQQAEQGDDQLRFASHAAVGVGHQTSEPLDSEESTFSTAVTTPHYDAGSVLDRLSNGEFPDNGRKPAFDESKVVEGFTIREALSTTDYNEQFEMAKHSAIRPFLAMNPSLYDDLYAWFERINDADIRAALADNAGYQAWKQGK